MKLFGTYGGVVEAINDPLRLGRVKVRVPHVYGSTVAGSGYVSTNDLPWALPAGMPAGGQVSSGGFSHLPGINDHVWVRFLDGEPEKPVWEWGMQTFTDQEALPLHSYDVDSEDRVGNPNRTAWTRYNHVFEINLAQVIVTTGAGYRIVLTDETTAGASDGTIAATTKQGNQLELNDEDNSATLTTLEDTNVQAGGDMIGQSSAYSWETLTSDYTVTAQGDIQHTSNQDIILEAINNVAIDALNELTAEAITSMTFTTPQFTLDATATVDITAGASLSVTAPLINFSFTTLSLGDGASEPFVLGTQFVAWATALLTYLSTHTHSNGNNGNPTGPPIVPPLPTVQPLVPQLISASIFGRL